MKRVSKILALALAMSMNTGVVAYAKDVNKVEIKLSSHRIVLEQKGNTAAIDATILKNNSVLNNEFNKIKFTSSDNSVAYEAYGFIYANGKGKATITAEYDNVKDTIEVEVKDTKSMFTTNLENVNNKFKMVTSTLPRSEVDWILNRARQMVYLSWTPTKNLCGWGVQNYFKANNTYQGIPYSQANQVDDSKFINSMSSYDFYNAYNNNGKCMPRYGNDCSGFVSFAFEISRHTTWTLASDSSLTKLNLDQVSPSDAVVTNLSGREHTFIIAGVSGNTFYCYEQTPMGAKYSTHSKSELSNLGYIGLRNMDWHGSLPAFVKSIE